MREASRAISPRGVRLYRNPEGRHAEDPRAQRPRVWADQSPAGARLSGAQGRSRVLLTDDAEIVAYVDEITALLLAASSRALRADNQRWTERYRWFFEAIAELQDALPDTPLDG